MKIKKLAITFGLVIATTLPSLASAKDILTSTPVTYMLSEQ
ncbi:ABC transporter substrate-binding protein, partial [Vibrio parahaemolyticus]|nr:ABC transporter substrate-binding protein [Vibrio parahaemolyticus]